MGNPVFRNFQSKEFDPLWLSEKPGGDGRELGGQCRSRFFPGISTPEQANLQGGSKRREESWGPEILPGFRPHSGRFRLRNRTFAGIDLSRGGRRLFGGALHEDEALERLSAIGLPRYVNPLERVPRRSLRIRQGQKALTNSLSLPALRRRSELLRLHSP